MEQTVAGATSTGTHGTGRDSASVAAQITGLELVTADGSVLRCSAEEHPEVFAAARLGPGRARRDHRAHLRGGAGLPADRPRGADGLRPGDRPDSTSWSPRTSTSSSTGSRTPTTATPSATTAARAPPRRPAGQRLDRRRAAVQRRLPGRLLAGPGRPRRPSPASPGSPAAPCRPVRTPTSRTRSSPARAGCGSWRWSTPLPREAAVEALRELKAMVERSRLRVSFPVEVRTAPADDIAAVHGLGPGHRVHRGAHVPGHAAPGVLHRRGADHDGARAAARTGASSTPGTPATWPGVYPRFGEFTARTRPPRPGAACSPTTTCGGCWATDARPRSGRQGAGLPAVGGRRPEAPDPGPAGPSEFVGVVVSRWRRCCRRRRRPRCRAEPLGDWPGRRRRRWGPGGRATVRRGRRRGPGAGLRAVAGAGRRPEPLGSGDGSSPLPSSVPLAGGVGRGSGDRGVSGRCRPVSARRVRWLRVVPVAPLEIMPGDQFGTR